MTHDTSTPVALITGAAGNLGRAVAAELLKRGFHLALLDRQAEGLRKAYGEPGPAMLHLEADLGDDAAVGRAARAVQDTWGRIDALCNLAGGFRMGAAVHETTESDWLAMMQMNAGSVLRTARAVVPAMIAQGHGRIVTVGAQAATRGKPRMGAYCASKASVLVLTESMAAELGPHGIHANCVLPSVLDTPENRRDMPASEHGKLVPLQRVADLVAFLVSEQGDALNGAALEATAPA